MVNLVKGQKVDLTKGNPGLTKINAGLGWDVNAFDSGSAFDLDAEVFLLGCTELPLAAEAVGLTAPTVDPTAELAKAAIRFCGYRVRTK